MMDRLLALKKAITEYFRQQAQNSARKLTSHEWTVTNEVCSLLDEVSEATMRMQGTKDTHLSQAMFIMREVIDMLSEEVQPIRVPNATALPTPEEGTPTEKTDVSDLTLEAQEVRNVLLEMMEEKGAGKASLKVERVCALLDPRRKSLDEDQFVNGSAALRTRAEADLNAVIAEFAEEPTRSSAPVPATVVNVELAEPAPKRHKHSRFEERRAARVAAAVASSCSGGVEPQASVTARRVLIGRELLAYLAEAVQIDVANFSLLGFWSRRGSDSVCPTTGKVTSPAEMPYLAFLARLYHGIEGTSCEAERNFSALAHLIGDLRSNMLASKVERMMFIRLNRHMVSEVRELDAAKMQARARAAKSAQKSAAAQQERSNMVVDVIL